MLKDIAYSLVFGKPVVMWLGLATGIAIAATVIVVLLNYHTKVRIPIVWHHRLAAVAIGLALIHIALAISLYI
ncbi:MAG: hypothetical protein PHF60_01865 [Candidatus ainarchaeum sp.]|nr:hypothetical protein [Candidatus ainarchaeum sp.]